MQVQCMEFLGNLLGVFSIIFIIYTVVFGIIFLLDVISGDEEDDMDLIREQLEQEREYFEMLGVILYWAKTAVEESELDPPAREDLIEAIDTIDELIIEDRINII